MTDDSTGGERIAKVMARAGVASRRDADVERRQLAVAGASDVIARRAGGKY